MSASKRIATVKSPNSSSSANRQHFFRSPFVISITVLILFQCSPYVQSSPTPTESSAASLDSTNKQDKVHYGSSGVQYQPNDDRAALTGDSSFLSQPNLPSISDLPSNWYVQPRAHANQFLSSPFDENDLAASKFFSKFQRYNQAADRDFDLDDSDVYSSSFGLHKRSNVANPSGVSHLKKRKQLNKPPMEVMNEIVNSIYLKR